MAHQVRANTLWSNYLITVNFNQPALTAAQAFQRAEQILQNLFTANNLWTWLRGTQGPFVGADRDLIEKIRARPTLEPGGAHNHSYHVHLLLEVQHRTSVKLAYNAIKQLVSAVAPGSNTDIEFVRNEDTNRILHYLNKTGNAPPGQITAGQSTEYYADHGFNFVHLAENHVGESRTLY